jgi:SAM-dependent methyltransferase
MRWSATDGTDSRFPIVWEECPCPLCAGVDHVALFEAGDTQGRELRFLLVKCKRCGLCFTNPRPDAASIQQFYAADYPCHHGKHRPVACAAGWLRKLLPIHGPARLLDFGCGAGDFLARMHALGWNATGLDRSEAAVARIRERHGICAHVGTLPNSLWLDASFEAITMWQSLEHVHQPLDVLHAAYRLLSAEGKLLVAVPNAAGFASGWFGAGWYGLDVPRHLTHFTPQTLRRMLGRAGFGKIDMYQERHNSWIRHSARGGFLKTRLGAGVAGWWGYMTRQAEGIVAIATK